MKLIMSECIKKSKNIYRIVTFLSLFIKSNILALLLFFLFITNTAVSQNIVNVGEGWAKNSVNTVVFRKNSLVTYKGIQFIAFYNDQQKVVLGKRKIGENNWELKETNFKGNTNDAHNCISIMTDGDGYLHLAWDHHSNKLNYTKSMSPFSLEMSNKLSMTGKNEDKVSYPEFYKMPNGELIFLYRDGSSGKGNLVLNKYDLVTKKWICLHENLIDGESSRNAYWQAFVDKKGTIHISWVWRESPDVASNHDLCYATSSDGGMTWKKSTGETYEIPINAATAEYAIRIPQKSELINQASMYADAKSNPYIAIYWRDADSGIPQYRIVYRHGNQWKQQNTGFRKTAFNFSGGGTKRIPISRPQIIVWKKFFTAKAAIVFRDEERSNYVSVAINKNIKKKKWKVKDILSENTGSWEPSFDTELWKAKNILHLFIQKTDQVDGEGKSSLVPQMVKVLEVKLK